MDEPQWYWCLDHKSVEAADGCPPDRRLGPFSTREEAANWKATFAARNEQWDKQDDDDEDDGDVRPASPR
jgi:hypothetical protein